MHSAARQVPKKKEKLTVRLPAAPNFLEATTVHEASLAYYLS